MKRSGKTVLSAIASEQLYSETSTPRAGTILKQAEFIPGLIQQLQNNPEQVVEEFETIRQTCGLDPSLTMPLADKPTLFPVTRPEGIRFSVTGNILDIQNPKKPWREHFDNLASRHGYFPNTTGVMIFRSSIESNHSTTCPVLRRNPERSWQETRP
jgi:hypothetical protein